VETASALSDRREQCRVVFVISDLNLSVHAGNCGRREDLSDRRICVLSQCLMSTCAVFHRSSVFLVPDLLSQGDT
jgi:predicted ribonuclease YlaK